MKECFALILLVCIVSIGWNIHNTLQIDNLEKKISLQKVQIEDLQKQQRINSSDFYFLENSFKEFILHEYNSETK